jgi:thiamine-phosphate pyrophosphorylase
MSEAEEDHCRLCLVTPQGVAPAAFAAMLEEALSGGDVASLFIVADPAALPELAKAAVPIAQAHGVAAIIVDDTRLAGHLRADGVLIDGGRDDLDAAIKSFRPQRIVGAGGARSRHDAMALGEADPDYLFFGRFDGDTGPAIFDKSFELAAWWAELFRIPAVVMGGAAIASVSAARDAAIEFVALRRAVWDHPAGPREAVREANAILAQATEPVR